MFHSMLGAGLRRTEMSEEAVVSIVAMICITVINVYFIRKNDKYDDTKD